MERAVELPDHGTERAALIHAAIAAPLKETLSLEAGQILAGRYGIEPPRPGGSGAVFVTCLLPEVSRRDGRGKTATSRYREGYSFGSETVTSVSL